MGMSVDGRQRRNTDRAWQWIQPLGDNMIWFGDGKLDLMALFCLSVLNFCSQRVCRTVVGLLLARSQLRYALQAER